MGTESTRGTWGTSGSAGMTRRDWLAGTGAGAAALLLAACGGQVASGPAQGESTGALPVTVRWTDDNSAQSRAFAEEFAKRFSAK
jgi:ABC-type glycerol-3-phosphate transport system substrate-binding protein